MENEVESKGQSFETVKNLLLDLAEGRVAGIALTAVMKDGSTRFITATDDVSKIHIVGAIEVLKSQAMLKVKLGDFKDA